MNNPTTTGKKTFDPSKIILTDCESSSGKLNLEIEDTVPNECISAKSSTEPFVLEHDKSAAYNMGKDVGQQVVRKVLSLLFGFNRK